MVPFSSAWFGLVRRQTAVRVLLLVLGRLKCVWGWPLHQHLACVDVGDRRHLVSQIDLNSIFKEHRESLLHLLDLVEVGCAVWEVLREIKVGGAQQDVQAMLDLILDRQKFRIVVLQGFDRFPDSS